MAVMRQAMGAIGEREAGGSDFHGIFKFLEKGRPQERRGA
jgi:hypothetical protein